MLLSSSSTNKQTQGGELAAEKTKPEEATHRNREIPRGTATASNMVRVTPANVGTVERATLSRDLLAPVAGQLSGDLPGLHRRCVLARHLGFFGRPGDVSADLAPPSGDGVEAIAVCRDLRSAVIVFRTPDGATVALRRQAKTQVGLYRYSPVPPLYLAFPSCFIQPGLVEFTLYAQTPSAPTSGEASTSTTAAEPRKRPWSWTFVRGPPGSSEFMPSLRSKVQGPRLGEDGHLCVDGVKFTYYENGMQIDHASTRVVQFPSVL